MQTETSRPIKEIKSRTLSLLSVQRQGTRADTSEVRDWGMHTNKNQKILRLKLKEGFRYATLDGSTNQKEFLFLV